MGEREEGLVVDQVVALRGDRVALASTSFATPLGGATVVTGPNGAGKSTLLRVLAGLLPAAAGTIRWRDGAPLGIGYLGHLDGLKLALTVRETLTPWAAADRVAGELERSGLSALADLPVRVLSAGQRRRLAIARLAARAAAIWLLDEPTVGLDGAAVDRFAALLAAHRLAGGIVIAATHVPLPLPNASTVALGAV